MFQTCMNAYTGKLPGQELDHCLTRKVPCNDNRSLGILRVRMLAVAMSSRIGKLQGGWVPGRRARGHPAGFKCFCFNSQGCSRKPRSTYSQACAQRQNPTLLRKTREAESYLRAVPTATFCLGKYRTAGGAKWERGGWCSATQIKIGNTKRRTTL